MENKLTPNKILRLMNLAEKTTPVQGRLVNIPKRDLTELFQDTRLKAASKHHEVESAISGSSPDSKSITNCESSGILDLDRCDTFGDSCADNLNDNFNSNFSLSKSTAFNPGEMTGRSTGATEMPGYSIGPNASGEQAHSRLPGGLEQHRFSMAAGSVDELAARLQKQSCDVQEVMRHSIANYSFKNSNLTHDEISFIRDAGDLPVMPDQRNLDITKNKTMDKSVLADTTSNMSVGSYFRKGCDNLDVMIGQANSPHYDVSAGPSIMEGDSRNYGEQLGFATINDSVASSMAGMDATLDRVPVRQPRAPPALAAPKLQHLAPARIDESTLGDTSMTISFIANCLGKVESEITPSMLFNEAKRVKDLSESQVVKLNPLTSNDLKTLNNMTNTFTSNFNKAKVAYHSNADTGNNYITTLKDNGKSDTGSTVASMKTVVSAKTSNKENIALNTATTLYTPRHKAATKREETEIPVVDSTISDYSQNPKLKSSATKSTGSTCCTVQENRISTSISLEESPSLHKEPWVEISVDDVEGYLGVCTSVTLKVTSLIDGWLTASFKYDLLEIDSKDIAIDLPRLPVLLSSYASKQVALTFTAYTELDTSIDISVTSKDASSDNEVIQHANVKITFGLPILQVITDEIKSEEISFTPTQVGHESYKSIVVLSDCPADLQLAIVVVEESSNFSISKTHVIKRSEVQRSFDADQNDRKMKQFKASSRATCFLPNDNAIKAVLTCSSKKAMQMKESQSHFVLTGSLQIYLLATNTLLKTVPLSATFGTAVLRFKLGMEGDKIHVGSEPHKVAVTNCGTIPATWQASVKNSVEGQKSRHFEVSPEVVLIEPTAIKLIQLTSVGSGKELVYGVLVMKNVADSTETILKVTSGKEPNRPFPIKATHSEIAWIGKGDREVNLKNITDRRVSVKCKLQGEGFKIESSRASGTDLLLNFAPGECRGLRVIFEPLSTVPQKAKLTIFAENDPGTVKSVRLHGCVGEPGLRWDGLVTCGDGALVTAAQRADVILELRNHSRTPAFFSCRLHFSEQYSNAAGTSRLWPQRAVVGGRSGARITLQVDWARVERLAREAGAAVASTLATVSVLAGAETTRLRILRILNAEGTEQPMPDRLSRLVGSFEGEVTTGSAGLQDFQETKKSLDTLTKGLLELTALIELPHSHMSDHTILLTDETMLEHQTLCD